MYLNKISKITALLIVLLGVSVSEATSPAPGMTKPLPASAPVPKNNKMTLAKIELGRQLFFDPRLSSDGTVSCNSCHNVMGAGEDNRPVSVGVRGQRGGRSAPTVFNAAFLSVQFWDGRAKTLEDQAKGPLTNPIEMGNKNHDQVIERLKKIPGYVQAFEKVFGGRRSASASAKTDTLVIDNLAQAIAAYERTLITPNAPFDRFLKGDKKAISVSAQRGWKKVQEVGCTTCHQGIAFAGPPMADGQGFFMKFPTFPDTSYEDKYDLTDDKGVFQVTHQVEDKNRWRVATWRNVALTAPYFHNGSVPTLTEAVRVMAKTQLNKDLQDGEVGDIVEFLKSLTGEFPKQKLPELPKSEVISVVDER